MACWQALNKQGLVNRSRSVCVHNAPSALISQVQKVTDCVESQKKFLKLTRLPIT